MSMNPLELNQQIKKIRFCRFAFTRANCFQIKHLLKLFLAVVLRQATITTVRVSRQERVPLAVRGVLAPLSELCSLLELSSLA